MKTLLSVVIQFYAYLLHLYPSTYRQEFEEEMLLDFSDMATDASKMGIHSLLYFCLRELVDFPINLLRSHLKEGGVFRILRSQPVDNGLRGALGFGVAFAIATTIGDFVFTKMVYPDNSMISRLQVFYIELFQTEDGFELISWIPSALSSLLTGLVLGILFAILFADHSKYPRYVLASMLGWFLHDAVRSFLGYCFNLPVFLGTTEYTYFSYITLILSGAFLGLILIVAKSEQKGSLSLLIAVAVTYPLIAYLYVKQVFNMFVFTTPWRFIALTILMVIFIGEVFVVVIKSDNSRKMLWLIVAGAIGQPIITLLVFFIGKFIYPPWPSWGIPYDKLNMAISNAIYGVLFGLFLGLVLGLQRKNDSRQVVA